MGLMDKIKNILFEEETVEIPIITKEEVVKDEEKKEKVIEKEERVIPKEEKKEEKKEEFRVNRRFADLVEEEEKPYRRDLFGDDNREFRKPEEKVEVKKVEEKKESKSPFLAFDEDEFELMSSSYRAPRREEKKSVPRRDAILYSKSAPEKEEVKKFKPSPIISPVYGILDKNYRKDDLLPTSSSEGTLPKIMDVDSVRKKAFGTLEEEIENKLREQQEEKKLEDKTIGDLIKENLGEESIEEEEIPHYNTEEIKITNFLDDDTSIDDAIDNSINTEELEETKEVSLKEPDTEVKEEEKVSAEEVGNTTLESDLFDLIDSMYEKEEE